MILAFLYSSIWLCNTIYEMVLGIEYNINMIETVILPWYWVCNNTLFPFSSIFTKN